MAASVIKTEQDIIWVFLSAASDIWFVCLFVVFQQVVVRCFCQRVACWVYMSAVRSSVCEVWCVCVCVRACVRACVSACVRACVRLTAHHSTNITLSPNLLRWHLSCAQDAGKENDHVDASLCRTTS